MSRAREAAYALFGAYRLARLDPSGLQYFNPTVEGFWRSFAAAAVVAPGYAILVALDISQADKPEEIDWATVAIVQAIAFVINWTAYPLAMHYLTALLDRGNAYLRYMVAYNWSALPQMAVFLPAAALRAILPGETGSVIMVLVVAAMAAYQWFIARAALDIKGGTAAGIVGFDFALSLFIAGVASTLRIAP